jgi:hypothetical protein
MKMLIFGFVAVWTIVEFVNAADIVSQREIVLNNFLSRNPSGGVSGAASGAIPDLSEPFVLSRGLQSSSNQDPEDVYTKWKNHYGFTFKTTNDESQVKAHFKKRLNSVVQHNKRFDSGLETYWMAIDGYSGLSESNFIAIRTGLNYDSKRRNKGGLEGKRRTTRTTTTTTSNPTTTTTSNPTTTTTANSASSSTTSPVTSVDYRTSPYYMPVKDQGGCGSCWAFAAIFPMEFGINVLYNISNTDLSEQQLVDCDTSNGGCNGGWPHYVYRNFINSGYGLTTEANYTYKGYRGTCKIPFRKENYKILRQTGVFSGIGFESQLEALVINGPTVVAVNADNNFMAYSGGIFNGCASSNSINHAVVAVGFGVENGIEYWIVRNSWGSWWGENGHIRIAKGIGMCNIQYYYTEPDVATN